MTRLPTRHPTSKRLVFSSPTEVRSRGPAVIVAVSQGRLPLYSKLVPRLSFTLMALMRFSLGLMLMILVTLLLSQGLKFLFRI
jgi:hypothetical protein